ncbi:Dihydrofolate synthase/folylpolyglutamate synthase [Pseudidiomarina piscicola]|uniref:Dihydrofolate synthase/folylpolyglutamate synthase n=1 Tax=Pseudidiomarina piscicola TaxID=2614830 RepID=A0A6S6WJ29_9GAMM|nr:bifunctional tetrahydrofolate synthase/dihydrofolate synthase [Pseudidiomarina piscicola]CAB0149536.1 Dihydrofolate synthase/folylpolyglutamate synthase [Pseudidiomarina piscicola]VZT38984.1 Dihydrofolate synthase/folylpolyglutamate synthase [Pseudomonas aeruginosa]
MNSTVSAPSATAGLDAWLCYLEALHPTEIDLGLSRVQQVKERLNIDPGKAQVLTVAGTNGKGSTVRYLESILRAAGYRTGAYISPHIYRYEERVRLHGALASADDFVRAFAAIEQARGDISLTYFEFGTLAAFWLLQRSELDVWILEVGLGGRLDAVNCLAADVAMVTSVGIDHIGFLGSDRNGIAAEKAGVFRAGKGAVIGEPDFPKQVLSELQTKGIEPQCVGHQFNYQQTSADHWTFTGRRSQLQALPMPQLPLPNAATALMALELLNLPVTEQAIREGLVKAAEPGRLQYVAGNPDYLLDVAHNPHAAAFLVEHLRNRFGSRPIYAVLGMLKDKDIAGTLEQLKPAVSAWYLADLEGPRGASAKELASALGEVTNQQPPLSYPCVTDAFRSACDAARESQQQPLVLVCGSFYTVAKIPNAE